METNDAQTSSACFTWKPPTPINVTDNKNKSDLKPADPRVYN